jgi:hypothetical protein
MSARLPFDINGRANAIATPLLSSPMADHLRVSRSALCVACDPDDKAQASSAQLALTPGSDDAHAVVVSGFVLIMMALEGLRAEGLPE